MGVSYVYRDRETKVKGGDPGAHDLLKDVNEPGTIDRLKGWTMGRVYETERGANEGVDMDDGQIRGEMEKGTWGRDMGKGHRGSDIEGVDMDRDRLVNDGILAKMTLWNRCV